MACATCGEYRFANLAQSSCHSRMNHAEFACSCKDKFLTETELKFHTESQEKKAEGKCKCPSCCRSFGDDKAREDHQRTKDHNPPEKPNSCPCGKHFKSREALDQHKAQKGRNHSFHPCFVCTRQFSSADQRDQHARDKDHVVKIPKGDNKKAVNAFTNAYYKNKVMVKDDDRKASVARVDGILGQIMTRVRETDGGNLYGPEIRKAGSYSTGTKVGKPDEFDTNIPLNVEEVHAKTRGTVSYKLEQPKNKTPPNNLNVTRDVKGLGKGQVNNIPNGAAAVELVDPASRQRAKNCTFGEHIIPRKVHEDLYNKMSSAIKELGMKDVHLSRNAHGPALTMTITNKGGHDTNVDVVPTINKSVVPVSEYCWPRPDTRARLPEDTIARVRDAGTHLVPKGQDMWAISHSKAEKALMHNIDKDDGCRRTCHRLLKCDLGKWKSQSNSGLKGITSHVLKHQTFWMNENYPEPGHWAQGNLGQRYCDMLKDLKQRVDMGKLPNYFNTMDNILRKADPADRHELSKCIKDRLDQLQHM